MKVRYCKDINKKIMPKMADEGTLGNHGRGTMDMTMVPQRLFSNYTENLKTWFLNKNEWHLTNKRVNNGSIKCMYSISLPFDLEDCARILFTVIDFTGKVCISESTLHD